MKHGPKGVEVQPLANSGSGPRKRAIDAAGATGLIPRGVASEPRGGVRTYAFCSVNTVISGRTPKRSRRL